MLASSNKQNNKNEKRTIQVYLDAYEFWDTTSIVEMKKDREKVNVKTFAFELHFLKRQKRIN